jgi:hypothetical protein
MKLNGKYSFQKWKVEKQPSSFLYTTIWGDVWIALPVLGFVVDVLLSEDGLGFLFWLWPRVVRGDVTWFGLCRGRSWVCFVLLLGWEALWILRVIGIVQSVFGGKHRGTRLLSGGKMRTWQSRAMITISQREQFYRVIHGWDQATWWNCIDVGMKCWFRFLTFESL